MPSHREKPRFNSFWQMLAVTLLIPVALIVAYPMFAKPRGSRQSQCMSNLKNCALAIQMYTSDYDEKFPRELPTINGKRGWPTPVGQCQRMYSCGWPFAAAAYIKNESVLLC